MAYSCKISAKECDGCGRCQDEPKPLICEDCGGEIYEGDKYYNIDDNIFCEDCGMDYFEENYRFTYVEED